MPIIRVEMLEGRTVEQKRACVEGLTKAFIEACGGRKEVVQVILTEIKTENWAFGGQLLSDRESQG